MKNKPVTYVLLAAVLFVWGYVLYKVFATIQGSDEPTIASFAGASPQDEDLSYYTVKDSVLLALNYRDPLEQSASAISENTEDEDIIVDMPYIPAATPPAPPPRETQIDYLGFIENEQTKQRVAIVGIDGKQVMLPLNTSMQGVKPTQIHADYMTISHKGQTKTIYK